METAKMLQRCWKQMKIPQNRWNQFSSYKVTKRKNLQNDKERGYFVIEAK